VKLTDEMLENLEKQARDVSTCSWDWALSLKREEAIAIVQELRASRRAKEKVRAALEHYSVIADRDGALGRDRREVARDTLNAPDVKEWLK
jgi:MoxR-like ATPase